MKARCSDPSHISYRYYGAKGVQVCQSWIDSFQAFMEDVGPRPPGTSLDRIDPEGNYEPGNVRWADAMTQRHNRRPVPIVPSAQPDGG